MNAPFQNQLHRASFFQTVSVDDFNQRDLPVFNQVPLTARMLIVLSRSPDHHREHAHLLDAA